MKKKWIGNGSLLVIAISLMLPGTGLAAGGGGIVTADPSKHFDPKGKTPSEFTVALQEQQRKTLPFEDKRDFEESKKGFIAAPPYKQIMAEAGNVAWDMGSYEFLLTDSQYESIHPSLQRQAVLNMAYGLYEVVPGKIYQIRGYNLANISFIKGDTGWIVFDPLTAKETAAAALKFVNEQLGERPVVAVVYSHSHADHFGGVRGVVDEADVASGKVKIIAPKGFMDHAVAENVYAGNAMNRRMFYQYGVLLPRSPYGHVDQSIGKNTAAGNLGLIPPTVIVSEDFETMTIDGVEMVFQNTPGTEAPAEMNTYFPELKAFWAAENITGTVHNIYTLRGALVRDALEWSKQINQALYRFGGSTEVMFASHSWPRWGNARVQEVMRAQRDIYANLNNEVLHQANLGVTINEIQNVYKPPKSLQNQWAAHSYHGSEQHNSRAVINRYLGYWDANPATLIPLSPRDSAPLYVEMMGGAKKIIAKSEELYAQGNYYLAQEILNKLVYAEPANQTAKSSGPDMVRAMSTDLWLDFLGIRLDSKRAEGIDFVINFVTPDNGEKYVLELSNATLTNIKGFQAEKPDLTITMNRTDLETVMMGKTTFDDQIKAGKAKLVGDRKPYDQLKDLLIQFEVGFEILPGTRTAGTPDMKESSFEQTPPAVRAMTD